MQQMEAPCHDSVRADSVHYTVMAWRFQYGSCIKCARWFVLDIVLMH